MNGPRVVSSVLGHPFLLASGPRPLEGKSQELQELIDRERLDLLSAALLDRPSHIERATRGDMLMRVAGKGSAIAAAGAGDERMSEEQPAYALRVVRSTILQILQEQDYATRFRVVYNPAAVERVVDDLLRLVPPGAKPQLDELSRNLDQRFIALEVASCRSELLDEFLTEARKRGLEVTFRNVSHESELEIQVDKLLQSLEKRFLEKCVSASYSYRGRNAYIAFARKSAIDGDGFRPGELWGRLTRRAYLLWRLGFVPVSQVHRPEGGNSESIAVIPDARTLRQDRVVELHQAAQHQLQHWTLFSKQLTPARAEVADLMRTYGLVALAYRHPYQASLCASVLPGDPRAATGLRNLLALLAGTSFPSAEAVVPFSRELLILAPDILRRPDGAASQQLDRAEFIEWALPMLVFQHPGILNPRNALQRRLGEVAIEWRRFNNGQQPTFLDPILLSRVVARALRDLQRWFTFSGKLAPDTKRLAQLLTIYYVLRLVEQCPNLGKSVDKAVHERAGFAGPLRAILGDFDGGRLPPVTYFSAGHNAFHIAVFLLARDVAPVLRDAVAALDQKGFTSWASVAFPHEDLCKGLISISQEWGRFSESSGTTCIMRSILDGEAGGESKNG
jgi:hypothetical protein